MYFILQSVLKWNILKREYLAVLFSRISEPFFQDIRRSPRPYLSQHPRCSLGRSWPSGGLTLHSSRLGVNPSFSPRAVWPFFFFSASIFTGRTNSSSDQNGCNCPKRQSIPRHLFKKNTNKLLIKNIHIKPTWKFEFRYNPSEKIP